MLHLLLLCASSVSLSFISFVRSFFRLLLSFGVRVCLLVLSNFSFLLCFY